MVLVSRSSVQFLQVSLFTPTWGEASQWVKPRAISSTGRLAGGLESGGDPVPICEIVLLSAMGEQRILGCTRYLKHKRATLMSACIQGSFQPTSDGLQSPLQARHTPTVK